MMNIMLNCINIGVSEVGESMSLDSQNIAGTDASIGCLNLPVLLFIIHDFNRNKPMSCVSQHNEYICF